MKKLYIPKLLITTLLLGGLYAGGVYLLSTKLNNQITNDSSTNQTNQESAKVTKTVMAVGDIACPSSIKKTETTCQMESVGKLVESQNPDAVFLLGDLQYSEGQRSEMEKNFTPYFKSFLGKSYTTLGNHDYKTSKGQEVRDVLIENKGTVPSVAEPYTHVSIDDWSIYILDSNCEYIGGCGKDSAEYKWFEKELKEDVNSCQIALWHHPVLSSSYYAYSKDSLDRMTAIWQLAGNHNVDIILNGHEHVYERFAPQKTDKGVSMRQFTVGTGGYDLRQPTTVAPYSEKIITTDFGALKLVLGGTDYSWEFISTTGKTLDSGAGACVK